MKKIILGVFMILFVTGCGNEVKTFDPNDLANELIAEVNFDDELTKFEGDISKLYDLPEVENYVVYIGSGATAEEIAIITLKDESDEESVREALEKRVEEQKQSFSNYVPEEVARLDKSVIQSNQKYVVLCVSDEDLAEDIINQYL